MKVMLINAPYKSVYGSVKRAAGCYFPVGLGYIASYLREYGFQMTLLDPEAENIDREEIKKRILEHNPPIVGISCSTSNFPYALEIARIARDTINPVIVIGGAHASSLPKEIIKQYMEIDIAVFGEGEKTMLELCQVIENGNDKDHYGNIKGIVYRERDTVIMNPCRPWIMELDKLPFPARDLVDMSWYRLHAQTSKGVFSSTIVSSRGCPFHCTFCASFRTMGRRYRFHSAEYTVREIEHLVEKYNVKFIEFRDDTFTLNKERVRKICELLIEKKLGVEWYCMGQVNTIDGDLLKLMKKAGCHTIAYGVESGDPQILKRIKKNIKLEQCVKALKESMKAGLRTSTFFILGNPGETKESIKKTIQFSIKLGATLTFFNVLVPYPGTEIFDELLRSGSLSAANWMDFVMVGDNPMLADTGLSKEDLQKYIIFAYLRYYLRPSQLIHVFKEIKSFAELKEYIRGALGLLSLLLTKLRKSLIRGRG